MQRVKVGMIGLAAVILLIGIASTILGSLNRDEPPQLRLPRRRPIWSRT
ncbi:hypothetical protein P0F65_02290 [Sphingomonas sp. I4]